MKKENEGGTYPSSTYKIQVGCGNLYITIIHRAKGRFKGILIPRTSKFHCPITTRAAIEKLATFGGRRNLKQVIKDLRGDKFSHRCEKYHIGCEAASCFDAVSQVIERWQKSKKKLPNKVEK